MESGFLMNMNGRLPEVLHRSTRLQLRGNSRDLNQRRKLGWIAYGSKVLFQNWLLICGLLMQTGCLQEQDWLHGDSKSPPPVVCSQEVETRDQLLLTCSYSKEVWNLVTNSTLF